MAQGYVAIQDLPSGANAGVITWWAAKSTANLYRARSAARMAGLAEPAEPSKVVVLHRALEALCDRPRDDGRLLARPAGEGHRTALVLESRQAGDEERPLEYRTLAVVRPGLEDDSRTVIGTDGSEWDLVTAALDEYDEHESDFTAGDVGSWLVRQAKNVMAVALRPAGGVYFIPAPFVDAWQAVVSVVKEAAIGEVYTVPALHSEDAARGILAAVLAETGAALDDIEADLAQDGLTERMIRLREARINAVMGKLDVYGTLLGSALEGIVKRTERAQAKASHAALGALFAGLED